MRIVEHSDEGGVVKCRYILLFFDTFFKVCRPLTVLTSPALDLRGHCESATQLPPVTILTNDLFFQGSIRCSQRRCSTPSAVGALDCSQSV